MTRSTTAKNILDKINNKPTKLGDLRKIAAEIKKDHQLATELWSTKEFFARQLAILIMDKKLLTDKVVDKLVDDIGHHHQDEKLQLIDWLMANQLTKDKNTLALIENWETAASSLKRRIFWYHQGRLRWRGQIQPGSENLLTKIEKSITNEPPEVQWAMNLLVGWIGVYEPKYRGRCIALGEKTGLYKDQKVSKGCTPNYLPEFIAIETAKRNQ